MKSLKFITLLSFFANFTVIKADELTDKLNVVIEDHEIMKQLGVHTITGGIANAGFAASTFAGTMLGVLLTNKAMRSKSLVPMTPDNFLNNDNYAVQSTIWLPYLASLIVGSYLIYKTPQWTDTYLLKVKEARTTKENIVVFVSRLLPWPLGVFTGEYLAKEIKKREATKKK